MRQYRILLSLLLLPSLAIHSQEFGAFPSTINWKQINSKTVRVIYPENMESQASRVANILIHMDRHSRTTVGPRKKKLNLVLNNQGVIPNGFVSLAPFRSEFFTAPYQKSHELGSLPWLDLLSIHEYRHANQFSNINQGLFKLGYLLGGEQVLAMASTLTIPDWYFEGDAVVTETALTKQGRGRIPYFTRVYRSIAGQDKTFSYMKVRNGSLKDDVPDHYPLGYLLCKYGREEYGDDLWMNVIYNTSRLRGLVYPFSNSLKKETGLSTRQLYKEALLHYKDEWLSENVPDQPLIGTQVNKSFKTPTYYRYPVFDHLSDGYLVHITSFKKTGAIYSISPEGKENKIVETGIQIDEHFAASKNYLSWSEISGHPRYSAVNYSDLVLFERTSKTLMYITDQARLASPSISPDESKLVAVNTDPTGTTNLVILSIPSGETIHQIPNPDRLLYTYPVWDLGGKGILVSGRTSDGEMYIGLINPENGEMDYVVPPVNHIIGPVSPGNNFIYFSSSFNGRDNLCAVSRKSGKVHQISDSRYGAYQPAVNQSENLILCSNQVYNGLSLNKMAIHTQNWPIITINQQDLETEYRPLYLNSEGGPILENFASHEFQSRKFHPVLHALKFHSWAPSLPITSTAVGLSLSSDNVLNNFHFEAGLDYYLNEGATGFSVAALYGKWFPIISLGYSQQYRHPGILEWSKQGNWERNINAGVKLPIDFSKGSYIRNAMIETGLQRTSVPSSSGSDLRSGTNFHFTSMMFHTHAMVIKQRAVQNITTPLGIGLEVLINRSFTGIKAGQLQVFGDAAVRGLLPNHNIVLGMAGKFESTANPYQYLDQNIYPRGYSILPNDFMLTVSGNYHFPIVYPDFGFTGLIYFKRVRANLFADVGMGRIVNPQNGATVDHSFLSIGPELIIDTQILNLIPLPLGIRYSLLGTADFMHAGRSSKFEVFIPVLRL